MLTAALPAGIIDLTRLNFTLEIIINQIRVATSPYFSFTQVHENFGNVLRTLQNTKPLTINVAAAIFLKNQLPIVDNYVKEVKKNYDSEVTTLDFSTQAATDYVNK